MANGYHRRDGTWVTDERTEDEKRRDAIWLGVVVFSSPVWIPAVIRIIVLIARALGV